MSLYDPFEQGPDKPRSGGGIASAEMTTSGYIQMSMEQELPIFTNSKKDFTPAAKITHAAVSNKYLVIAMENNALFRMSLTNPALQDEIPLGRYATNHTLAAIFLDPHGNHLLLSFAVKETAEDDRTKAQDATAGRTRTQEAGKTERTGELVYLSRKTNKPKPATKFHGHVVTAVAWNSAFESENSTGPILLGTSKGLIFETEITFDGDKFFTSSLEQYWRQLPNYLPLYGTREMEGLVFQVGKGSNTPVTGLEFYNVPDTDHYTIFATTANRLYEFGGATNADDKPYLQQIFPKYLKVPEKDTMIEVNGEPTSSQVKLWRREPKGAPSALVWIVGKRIYYVEIEPSAKSVIKNIDKQKPLVQLSECPQTFVTTKFHILVGYRSAVEAVCLLDGNSVYNDDTFNELVDVVVDAITGTIWAVTATALHRFKVNKEERDVWRIYCDQENFDMAKYYSAGNEAHYNQVLLTEARSFFANGDYALSAAIYAETRSSFEEICLKFIQAGRQDALKIFLLKKLDRLPTNDNTQKTMIVLWLVELYLERLEELRLGGKELTNEFVKVQAEFDHFLAIPKVAERVREKKGKFYELMACHGDKENAMKLTTKHNDYEQLIRQCIYKNSFHDALGYLKAQTNRDLYYKFVPVLIQEIPRQVVQALVDPSRKLKPDRLLPALVGCDGEEHSLEIIKYLEFCVGRLKCKEKSIHNLLLSLYAKYDAGKLMDYLDSQGQDIFTVNYDVYFALRLCQEKQLTRACVSLSCILGLWETAVDLALKIDKDLAIHVANQPPHSDDELRKKLWLKIAKFVISDNENIEKAMELLWQCDLIKIEDILPFFSDFVTIDHFREAVCNSLKGYNQQIEDLKEEMEEATKSAENVRTMIQSFRNKRTEIRTVDVCDVCESPLMSRPFYLFPCRHNFHSDCLLKELNPMLGPAKSNKLADLQRQLNMLNAQTIDNVSTGSTGMSARDSAQAEIDAIVAAECLYCGENMIRNIDVPFFTETEYNAILTEWE